MSEDEAASPVLWCSGLSPIIGDCTGDYDCAAVEHVHGCFADDPCPHAHPSLAPVNNGFSSSPLEGVAPVSTTPASGAGTRRGHPERKDDPLPRPEPGEGV
jgi:hypothetical protein